MLGDPDTTLTVNHDPNRITQGYGWRNLLERIGGRVKPGNLARDLCNPKERRPVLNCNLDRPRVRSRRTELRHPQSVDVDLAEIGRSRIRKPYTLSALVS